MARALASPLLMSHTLLACMLLASCCAAQPLQNFQCLSQAVASCPAAGRDQCSVLLDYKLSVKQEPDKDINLSTWEEGKDCCTWKGITCSAAGNGKKYVTNVRLVGGTGTGGRLPDSFSSLSRLTEVTMDAVGLEGTIPASWGNLTDLYQVSLWSNTLTGSLPASWAKLKKLKILSLQDNQMTAKLPPIPNIQTMDISNNQFSGTIPASFDVAISFNAANNKDLSGCVPPNLYRADVVVLGRDLKGPGSYYEGTSVTGKC